jgi:uncharacterized protein (TIGR02145 family)
MKKLLLVFFILCQSLILNAQTITGKLVDQDSIGISGLQLKLYIHSVVYSATSGSDGSFTFNNVTEVKEEKLPTGYSVSENFPNPFNPKTRIFITLPNSGYVKVNIYNVLGQKVLADIDRYFNAGTSYIDLELKGLPNGIYLANISIDEKYKVVKKIMLLYGSQHLNTSVVTEPNISSQPISLSKTSSSVNLDSLVVTGSSINKNKYTSLPQYTGSSLNIGNIVVDQTMIIPCTGIPTVIYGGQTYHTVQIGTQCWLRENMNVGTMINNLSGGVGSDGNQSNNSQIEKYCYNDDSTYCATYGGLYQWAEAVQYQNGATNTTSPSPALTRNVQGICPSGWHIPSLVEFQTLSTAVNNNGNALKAVGQGSAPDGGAGTNTSGFSALLAGRRNDNSNFDYLGGSTSFLGGNTSFWSSTEGGADSARYMNLGYGGSRVVWDVDGKDYGFSVRCLKD